MSSTDDSELYLDDYDMCNNCIKTTNDFDDLKKELEAVKLGYCKQSELLQKDIKFISIGYRTELADLRKKIKTIRSLGLISETFLLCVETTVNDLDNYLLNHVEQIYVPYLTLADKMISIRGLYKDLKAMAASKCSGDLFTNQSVITNNVTFSIRIPPMRYSPAASRKFGDKFREDRICDLPTPWPTNVIENETGSVENRGKENVKQAVYTKKFSGKVIPMKKVQFKLPRVRHTGENQPSTSTNRPSVGSQEDLIDLADWDLGKGK